MLPTSDMLNNYHDKKRTTEYYRISKLIEVDNKNNPRKPPKAIIGSKPEKNEKKTINIVAKKHEPEVLTGLSSYINRGVDRNDTLY